MICSSLWSPSSSLNNNCPWTGQNFRFYRFWDGSSHLFEKFRAAFLSPEKCLLASYCINLSSLLKMASLICTTLDVLRKSQVYIENSIRGTARLFIRLLVGLTDRGRFKYEAFDAKSRDIVAWFSALGQCNLYFAQLASDDWDVVWLLPKRRYSSSIIFCLYRTVKDVSIVCTEWD